MKPLKLIVSFLLLFFMLFAVKSVSAGGCCVDTDLWGPQCFGCRLNECTTDDDCRSGGGSCDPGYSWVYCSYRYDDCQPVQTCKWNARGQWRCQTTTVCTYDKCADWACVADTPSCTESDPGAPSLVGPANGVNQDVLAVSLSWSGVAFGTGCPDNTNEYLVYLEAGDSTPDVLVATLGSGTTSYDFTGVADTQYYWQVVASNGSRTTGSVIRSLYTPGLVTGTLFDASNVDSCALMALQPKISGGVVNLDSVSRSYAPTTDVLGVYSQYVISPDSYTASPVVVDPYTPVPKLICQGTVADFTSGGSTVTLDFGFWRTYGGWWQAVGGDVYGGGGVESVIPNSLPAGEKYLIKEDAAGNSGLAYYEAGELNLGGASGVAVSEAGWEAESGYGGQDINHAYYLAKMRTLDKTDWDGIGKPSYNPIEGYEIYTHTGDVIMNFDVNSGEKRIFMVDGNVLVDSNMVVAVGSHLTVVASGTITYADNVGEVHGWWVGDRIVIASTGDELTEVQFRGEGSFVGYAQIEFNRDRGLVNNVEPAEEFVYRPDLMINAPDGLKFSRFKWLEQAP